MSNSLLERLNSLINDIRSFNEIEKWTASWVNEYKRRSTLDIMEFQNYQDHFGKLKVQPYWYESYEVDHKYWDEEVRDRCVVLNARVDFIGAQRDRIRKRVDEFIFAASQSPCSKTLPEEIIVAINNGNLFNFSKN